MAQAVQLCNTLQGIGFTADTATYIVDTQGFDTPEDCAILMDEEAVNICKVTYHPGGNNAANNGPNNGLTVCLTSSLLLRTCSFATVSRISRTFIVCTPMLLKLYSSKFRTNVTTSLPSLELFG